MKAHILLGFLLMFALASYAASCSDIEIDARDISVGESSTQYFTFYIENDSDEDFDVEEVDVGDTSSKFSTSVSDYDEIVRDNDEGEIEIRIRSYSVSRDTTGEAYLKVRGEFDEGKYCSFSAIGTEYFDVTVEDEDEDVEEDCEDIRVVASNVTMDEDDVVYETFSVENDSDTRFYVDGFDVSESSAYLDADLDDYDSSIPAEDEGDFTLRLESGEVSSDRTVTVRVKVRGHFSGGESCSYSETEDDSFIVRIEDAGDGDFDGGGNCSDLELGVSNITVEKGDTVEKNFVLENNANERFYVDYVDVYDKSGDIRAESNGYDKKIYANSVGLVGVKVKAYSDAEVGRERAYITVRGHFQGGSTCTLEDGEETFYVEIVEAEEEPYVPPELPKYSEFCRGFILSAPSSKTIQESGTVALRIENNTPYRATVRFYGGGLQVEPSLLSVPSGFESDSYIVSVFASRASSMLYYEIETFNCLTKESTRIVSTAAAEEQEEEEEAEEEEQEEEPTAAEALQAITGTAFVALGENAALIGLAIVLLIVGYFVGAAMQKRKVKVK